MMRCCNSQIVRLCPLTVGVLVVVSTVCMAKVDREVQLARGQVGSFRWSVSAYRGSGRRRTPVCIRAMTSSGESSGSVLTVCDGNLSKTPIISSKSEGKGHRERTILVMVYPPRVRQVRVWLRGRKRSVMHLMRLSRGKRMASGVKGLRYGVREVAGRYCLRGLEAFAGSGRLVEVREPSGCER